MDAHHGQLYVRFFPTKHLNMPFEHVEHAEHKDSEPDLILPRPEDLDDGPEARLDNARVDSEGACEGLTNEEFARALRMIIEDLAQGEDVDKMCRELRQQKENDEQLKDGDTHVESEHMRTEEPESSENMHKGQLEVSVMKAHITYWQNKGDIDKVQGPCNEHDPELYCNCGITFECTIAFQRECEHMWAYEEDADVAEDVRAEGSLCPESKRDSLEGRNGSPGMGKTPVQCIKGEVVAKNGRLAVNKDISAHLTYLGESCLVYRQGRRVTPFPSISEAGFEEAGSLYGADVESGASDVEMTETDSENEQDETEDKYKQLKSSQEIPELMEVEGDNESDRTSATAAGEDEGAKDKCSSSSSSAQASCLGTPTTFRPSTIKSYKHDHQKLGEFEGFLHNLLGEAFHEVYEEMCEFFQERLQEAHS
ncbi:hypothetical protein C8Q73DRAFT_661557 [Cubamyces lactineus]|nr:hypothetical protein C8Q73DRAFT_661557 [Cubamyces lactineus]